MAPDLVYVSSLHLPGKSFLPTPTEVSLQQFVEMLKTYFKQIQPTLASRHGSSFIFIHPDLKDSEFVFLRHDGARKVLQNPYDGPCKVLRQCDKTFMININEQDTTVSLNRLKPTFVLAGGYLPTYRTLTQSLPISI